MKPPEASGAGQDGAFDLELPGIHPEVGLRYSADNRGIYLRMLTRFREVKGGLSLELRQTLAAGELKAAARLAHTMKSTALAIGAVELSETSRALEEALEGPAPDRIQALLGTFEAQLEEILAGLRAALP